MINPKFGEIGIHERFRFFCRKACGFDSVDHTNA